MTLAQYSRGPRYAPETLDLPTYHRVLAQRHNLHSSVFAPLRASCPYIMSKVDVYPFCVLQHTHFRLQPKGLALDFFNVGACHGAASSFTSLALVQMMTRLKIKVSCLCHTPHYVISYHRASAIVPIFLSGRTRTPLLIFCLDTQANDTLTRAGGFYPIVHGVPHNCPPPSSSLTTSEGGPGRLVMLTGFEPISAD